MPVRVVSSATPEALVPRGRPTCEPAAVFRRRGRRHRSSVTLMADYGEFLWSGDDTPSPEALGLSPDLAVRLRAWHAEWEDAMYGDPAALGSEWVLRGHELAVEVDQQLTARGAGTDVYYDEDDDPRPMSAR